MEASLQGLGGSPFTASTCLRRVITYLSEMSVGGGGATGSVLLSVRLTHSEKSDIINRFVSVVEGQIFKMNFSLTTHCTSVAKRDQALDAQRVL
jgi:hypothetical protein